MLEMLVIILHEDDLREKHSDMEVIKEGIKKNHIRYRVVACCSCRCLLSRNIVIYFLYAVHFWNIGYATLCQEYPSLITSGLD